jgi:hypothetical protein
MRSPSRSYQRCNSQIAQRTERGSEDALLAAGAQGDLLWGDVQSNLGFVLCRVKPAARVIRAFGVGPNSGKVPLWRAEAPLSRALWSIKTSVGRFLTFIKNLQFRF